MIAFDQTGFYIAKSLVKKFEIRPPAGAFSMWSSSLPTKLQKSSSFKARSGPSKISHVDIFVSNDDQQSNESIRKKSGWGKSVVASLPRSRMAAASKENKKEWIKQTHRNGSRKVQCWLIGLLSENLNDKWNHLFEKVSREYSLRKNFKNRLVFNWYTRTN